MSFIASPPPSRHGHGTFGALSSHPPRPLDRPDLFPLLHSLQEDPSFAEVLLSQTNEQPKKSKRLSRANSVVGSPLLRGLLAPSRAGSSAVGGGRRTQTPAERYAAQARRGSQLPSAQSSVVGSPMVPEVVERSGNREFRTRVDGAYRPMGLWELLERPVVSAPPVVAQDLKSSQAPLHPDQPLPPPSNSMPNRAVRPTLPPGAAPAFASPSSYPTHQAQTLKKPTSTTRAPPSVDLPRKPHLRVGAPTRGRNAPASLSTLPPPSSPLARLTSIFKKGSVMVSRPRNPSRHHSSSSAPDLSTHRTRTRDSSFSSAFKSLALTPSSPSAAPSALPVSPSPKPRLVARDDVVSLKSLDSDKVWERRRLLLEVLREGPPTAQQGIATADRGPTARPNEASYEARAALPAARMNPHASRSRSLYDLVITLLDGRGAVQRRGARSLGTVGGRQRSESGYWSYGESHQEWDEARQVKGGAGWKGWKRWARKRSAKG